MTVLNEKNCPFFFRKIELNSRVKGNDTLAFIMGIPSYFIHLVKQHPHILKRFVPQRVNNLYMDCNSFIYEAYHAICSETESNSQLSLEMQIIHRVIQKLDETIAIVNPTDKVIVAFDGVAPVAKLEHQRARRYKSWYTQQLFQSSVDDAWNTAAITPGTTFMGNLSRRVKSHYDAVSIVKVSGSNEVGEGEHKICEYLRSNKEQHASQTTFIYGLDADLIMLAMNHLHICPQMYLFRETPHFIQSIDKTLEPNEQYVLDIKALSDALPMPPTDYVMLCFLLGNDFLPQFPTVNLRRNGMEKVMEAYMHVGKPLTNGNSIIWPHLQEVFAYLASKEYAFFVDTHQFRAKMERRGPPADLNEAVNLTPTLNRIVEKQINLKKSGWETRYYHLLFPEHLNINDLCKNYIEGLEWTLKYYTSGCPDWRWKYNYHYPPLLKDLAMFDNYNAYKPPLQSKPVTPLVQLCYVLPRASLKLLPHKLYLKLLREKNHWYGRWTFQYAYCKYLWEAHVLCEDIDLCELEQLVNESNNEQNT